MFAHLNYQFWLLPRQRPVPFECESEALACTVTKPRKKAPRPSQVIQAKAGTKETSKQPRCIKRQANIVLRQRSRSRPRTRHITQFRQVNAVRKSILIRKPVQHRSHPPGKPLSSP